jgi:5'-deoxynucleotidase YfbR-like HD superfamily hydrolase
VYLLGDTRNLLDMLFEYKKENINGKFVKKMDEVCMINPDFNEAKAFSANIATGYLFNWSKSMYDFYTVFTET